MRVVRARLWEASTLDACYFDEENEVKVGNIHIAIFFVNLTSRNSIIILSLEHPKGTPKSCQKLLTGKRTLLLFLNKYMITMSADCLDNTQ